MSVNKVILIGNVGKDPETRYLDEGVAVSKFPLATSEVYRNKEGEKVTTTEWHNVVLWRGLAQVAEKYVKKGTQLYIEGRIRTRSYDDRDGNKKYFTEIVGDIMQMLGKKQDDDTSEQPSAQNNRGYSSPQKPAETDGDKTDGENDFLSPENESDDLPF
ncbi:MAG: single-stranded DNA-binding protein [Bacteroidales bacterium]|nr:single-stranded DNA-binding protein [Bacteroidales bacterium]MBN2698180.1 single-stranded DNA-binding protein [Bacteroidales bacterium]